MKIQIIVMKNIKLLLLLFASILIANYSKSQSHSADTLINIGSHSLHFNIKYGNGIPILFESGGGNDGSVWSHLVDSLHAKLGTTIITYDRAGYGRSELNNKLDDKSKGYILNAVKDLELALKTLGLNKELIFVAHSFGGFNAALFAQRNPQLVKGIVLIDANLKCFFDANIRKKFKEMLTDSVLLNFKSTSLGLYYLMLAYDESVELIQQTTFPPEIPIIDLVAGNPPNPFNDLHDSERWVQCHKEFGTAYPNRVYYIAKNCGHYIFIDNPKFVIDHIIEMNNKVTNKK